MTRLTVLYGHPEKSRKSLTAITTGRPYSAGEADERAPRLDHR